MQSVGRRDTPAELAVRTRLHRMGLRFRVDHPPLAGVRRRADILFTKARVAVYVDGCYWHGCPQHCRMPAANSRYWRQKISRNISRDRASVRSLKAAGWRVIRIWGHALRYPARVSQRIIRELNTSRRRCKHTRKSYEPSI